ncbi:MAG: GspL/Epsl periplasmic domain-containing protein [Thermodesulfovibrionales bacterium]|jgi:type II secretory pathway component PulL
MRTIGFLDIETWGGNKAFAVHLFGNRAGRFEYEKTIEYSSTGSSGDEFDTIGEFYLSLPLNLLNFRIMRFPFSDKQKLKDIIPFELDGLILGGSESIVFDSIALGESDGNFDVLVACIEKNTLGDILTNLASIGIDPQVVTSLELQSVLAKGNGDVASSLMDPSSLGSGERIEAAKKELVAHTLNLRTGPFAYTKDAEKLKKGIKLTAILFLLLALVINGDLALRLITAQKETSSVRKEMRNIYAGLFPGEKKITDEIYQLKSHMKELKERGEVITGLDPLQFMLELSRRTVPGVKFDEINLDREIVTTKGEAVAMDNVEKAKAMLSEFMTDATVSDIKTSVEGKIRFTVVAKVRSS